MAVLGVTKFQVQRLCSSYDYDCMRSTDSYFFESEKWRP